MKLTTGKVAFLQGLYYCLTAVWPIVHIGSFMWVTGPKTDVWLVKTVAVLLLVMGLVFLFAARRKTVPDEVKVLAIGAALGLILIDVIYALDNTISDIYLYDAAAEALLIFMWIWAWNSDKSSLAK